MLLTDSSGRLKAPGRYKVSRVFDADAGALPTGFTVGNAAAEDAGVTSVWNPSTAGVPGLAITSGTATGSTSTTRRRAGLVGAAFDASKCSAVRLRAVVTGGAEANILPKLGFSSTTGATTVGATVLHQIAADYCRLFTNGVGGSTSREMTFKWTPAPIRHDLSIWWTPRDGYLVVAVEEDVPIYADRHGTALGAGPVYPVVSNTAQANGLIASCTVHRLELDMYYA